MRPSWAVDSIRDATLTASPHVVEEPASADDTGDHGAHTNADPKRRRAIRILEVRHCRRNVEGKARQRFDVVGPLLWNATNHHVRIAAGLDFLQAVQFDQLIELGVQPVQKPDQVGRSSVTCTIGEARDVGEQHRSVVVLISDHASLILEALGNAGRQDIGQQRL
jgi:hypothetical protein